MIDIPDALKQWPGHTGTWNRWPNDRGSLNLITPEATQRGAACIRDGRVVSCARTIKFHDPNNPDVPPAGQEMVYSRQTGDEDDTQIYGDRVSFRVHGTVNTHIDAFSHLGYKGYCYGGVRIADVVNMEDGASRFDALDLSGIVTRGCFIDVARRRGVTGLMPGDHVTVEDIAPLLGAIQPGDAAVIRTGVTLTGGRYGKIGNDGKPDLHFDVSGLHFDCVEALAKKGISVLASDSPSDTYPSPSEACESPVHVLCLVFYGIPLVHNMDLEELGELCASSGRDTFMFMVGPLRFPKATGSPCTPLAVL